jgi:type II secretory pathway pseudopilin PulG
MPMNSPIRLKRPSEEGYMMAAVIFLMALLVLSMAIAVPRIKDSIQRDREVETMHRGKQYVRAIQLYYRKFHAYPPNIDALVKTNDIRFLRKKYLDPMTGKDDWKPIQFGQNKSPTVYGFFGQPIGGSSIAGTGPGGGNSPNGLNSGQPGSQQSSSSIFSSSSDSANSGSSPNGATVSASGTSGTGTDPNAAAGSGPGTGFGGGQTFGGAGIIGFSPASPKQSILIYKKKNHYNEWEFVYDPLSEQMTSSSFGAGLNTSPLNGQQPGTAPGSPAPGSGPGSGGIFSNPTQPTPLQPPPQQPQQQ